MRGRVDSQPTTQSTNLTEETIDFTGSLELRDVPISLSPWQHATFKWEGLTHGNVPVAVHRPTQHLLSNAYFTQMAGF